MQPPDDHNHDQTTVYAPTAALPASTSASAWVRMPMSASGGGGVGAPLVSVAQVKAHLAILRAFARMKEEVVRGEGGEGERKGEEGKKGEKEKQKQKWGWFVSMAVEKFAKWLAGLKPGDENLEMEVWLPPLDVFMVCHTYMLNPKWFGDDAERIPQCQILYRMTSRTMDLKRIEPLLRPSHPSQARIDFWNSKMRNGLGGAWVPWYYHSSSPKTCQTTTIACPGCKSSLEVDLMTPDGTGYFQTNFTHRCRETPLLYFYYPGYQCLLEGKAFTKETLGARKLAEDLAKFEESGRVEVLPSLAYDTTPNQKKAATMIKDRIIDVVAFKASTWSRKLGDAPSHIKWFSDQVHKCKELEGNRDKEQGSGDKGQGKREPWTLADDILQLFLEFKLDKFRPERRNNTPNAYLLDKIRSAYNDDKPFSVELVGAIMRQGSFIDKMNALNWTKEGYFDDLQDERVLHHAIARYHAFLDLLSVPPNQFHVPTLDIDLVWHTHQLMPAQYQNDMINYVGRFIDHDDKVEGLLLSDSFDKTCRAWKQRFGIDYTLCGCHPLPPDPSLSAGRRNPNSIGRQLSKLVNVMKLKLSRSSSSEGQGQAGGIGSGGNREGGGGGGEEEAPFDTLKTFGRSAMLRPPPPAPAPPSSNPKDDSLEKPSSDSKSKKPNSANLKESEAKEHPAPASAQRPHPDVLVGSHPSDHDAVHYTARPSKHRDTMLLGIYQDKGKEMMSVWEKAHPKPDLDDGKGKEKKKKKKVDGSMNVNDGYVHPSLGYDTDGNGVPPWGVFLYPVPIVFENGNGGGKNGGEDPNHDHSCVSIDASQVKMAGGCASCSSSGCGGTVTSHEGITANSSIGGSARCGGWSGCGAANHTSPSAYVGGGGGGGGGDSGGNTKVGGAACGGGGTCGSGGCSAACGGGD